MKKKKKKIYIHPIIVVTFVYIFYTLNVMTIMRYIFTTIWGTEYKYTSDFIFKRKKETGRVLSLILGVLFHRILIKKLNII